MLDAMPYDDFVAFYKEHGKCPNDIQMRSKPLNEKQLQRRYKQYVLSVERRNLKIEEASVPDEEWIRVRELVFERDQYECVLYGKLSLEEVNQINPRSEFDPYLFDPAHVLPRSTHPHLVYEPENVVTLSRFFHRRLDTYQSPLTGAPISQQEHREWWARIVGEEKLRKLERGVL